MESHEVLHLSYTKTKKNTDLMPGASNDGREHGARGIVSGESGFAHSGAIVHYKSCYVVVAHIG